jgi:hypothetical protein
MTKKDEIKQYREVPALSQSEIKAILLGPQLIGSAKDPLFYREKESFLIGDGVDTLITQGQEEFINNYYIMSNNKPSDAIMSIVNMVFSEVIELVDKVPLIDFENYKNEILKACDYHNYQPRWKDDTKVEKIIKDGSEYWVDLVSAGDRQILDVEQTELIFRIVYSLLNSPYTTDYFQIVNIEGVEIIYQLPLYFTYKNIRGKGLLDMIIINNNDFPVTCGKVSLEANSIQPIDLKTTGEYTTNFVNVIKKFRYDIQGIWYTEALIANYPKFKILPFKFIVESVRVQGCPLVYTMSELELLVAKYGANMDIYKLKVNIPYPESFITPTEYIVSKPIYGIDQGVELFKWYTDNNQWSYHKEVVEKNGELEMKLYG